MIALDAVFWAVCLVLVGSGVSKITDPRPFQTALIALGPPVVGGVETRWPARSIGAIEVLLGLAGLSVGGSLAAAAVAATYAAFTAVVLLARRRGLDSCGCFGARSGRPSTQHAVINAASTVVALGAAATSADGVADGLAGRPGVVNVVVVLLVLVAAVAIVVADTR